MSDNILNITWRSEEDEILIDFVKDHDMLYNVNNKKYRKTQLKEQIWGELARVVNKTAIECQKRWAYIRDYYVRRRGKPGSSGEAARKRSSRLSFLDDVPSKKRSTTFNIDNTTVTDDTQDIQDNMIFIQTTDVEETLDETDTSQHESQFEPKFFDSCLASQSSEPLNKKKKIQTHSEDAALQQSHREEADETDLFFSSMAKIVKKLPPYERAQLRMQIGELVGKAELNHLMYRQEYSRSTSDASNDANFV